MTDNLLFPPKGKDRYEAVVDSHCYYVDKTTLLKAVFSDNSDQVLQITRPRRFGKSLTMSMFYAFLTINYKDPSDLSRHQELFSNRQIYQEK